MNLFPSSRLTVLTLVCNLAGPVGGASATPASLGAPEQVLASSLKTNTDDGDEVGTSVAASGGHVIVGASHEASSGAGVNGDEADGAAPEARAGYAFDLVSDPSDTVVLDHLAIPAAYDNAAGFSGTWIWGQTFTSGGWNVIGFDLYIGNPEAPGNPAVNELEGAVELRLYYAGDLEQPVLLASRTIGNETSVFSGLVSFDFESPVPTQNGQLYFFGLVTQDDYGIGLRSGQSSTYPDGWQAPLVDGRISPQTNGRDLSFRIRQRNAGDGEGPDWTQIGSEIGGRMEGALVGRQISLSHDGRRLAILGQSGASQYVSVYELNGSTWGQLGSDLVRPAGGLNISLSGDGNRLAVGFGRGGNASEADAGEVRVYEYSDGDWMQLGEAIVGEGPNDSLRYVSLDYGGATVATGAPWNSGAHTYGGHVRVFRYLQASGDWLQVGLDIDGRENLEYFSVPSISSNGRRLAVGGWGNDAGGLNAGVTRVFEFAGNSWTQLGADLIGRGPDDRFASACLSSDSNRLAVRGNLDNGHVSVFDYDGRAWNTLGQELEIEQGSDEILGSVSISGNGERIAVGFPKNDANGPNSGSVRVYDYIDDAWSQIGAAINGAASGDDHGAAVTLSANGRIVAVGAPRNSDDGPEAGQVRVFGYGTAPSLGEFVLRVQEGGSGTFHVSKILRRASDPEGDPAEILSVESTSTQGGAVSLEDGLLEYTAPPGFTGMDEIIVTLKDGYSVGARTFSVGVDANSLPQSARNPAHITIKTDGTLEVRFHGVPGFTYGVERSIDMVSWMQIAAFTADAEGRIVITDPEPPEPTALYRLVYPAMSTP